MALPPRGDPRRPMHAAARSLWSLGGLFVLFGLCGTGSIWYAMSAGGGGPGVALSQFVGLLFYFVPGLLYVVFAIYLKQRQLWALIGAIVVASLHLVLLLIGAISFILLARTTSLPTLPLVLIGGIMGVIALALTQLVFQLSRSFPAIRLPPYGKEDRGFEPVAVHPVVPAAEATAPLSPHERTPPPPPAI